MSYVYQNPTPRSEPPLVLRRLVINAFEAACLIIVIVPTVAGVGAVLISMAWGSPMGVIMAIPFAMVCFVVGSFLAGGGLLLVEIADLLRDIRDAARRKRRNEMVDNRCSHAS